MLVRFQIDGGLACLPGLRQQAIIDTSRLDPHERLEIERLIEASGILDGPTAALGGRRPRGADTHTYTLDVVAGTRRRLVRFSEPLDDAAFERLVLVLSRHVASGEAAADRRPQTSGRR